MHSNFIYDTFSVRLKLLRTSSKLTLEQLGKDIGVTKGAISNLENNRKHPSIELVITLAEYFDVSVDYLLGLIDEPTKPPIHNAQIPEEELATEIFSVSGTMEQLKALIKYMRENDFDYEIGDIPFFQE